MLFLLKCLTTLIFFYFISALLHTCMITECIFWSHISTHNYFFFFFLLSSNEWFTDCQSMCERPIKKGHVTMCMQCTCWVTQMMKWTSWTHLWPPNVFLHLTFNFTSASVLPKSGNCLHMTALPFLHSVAHPRFHHSDNEIKCAYVAPLQCVPPFQQIEATDISRPHSTLSVQSVVREVHTAGLPDYTNTDKKGKCCQELQLKWRWKN